MSVTFGCIKGKMGTTEYYLAKMKAGSLVNTVGYASQIAEWDDIDIEEKIQRELDEKRVIEDIVPYLIQDPDRFFGSLIVDVYHGWEKLEFESLAEIAKVPKAYANQVDDIGFITIPDNQILVALDGQHRLLALSVAIKGYRGLPGNTKISDDLMEKLKPNPSIADEDITVIIVKHTDTVTIRKIFNKINRYAKSTSRGDNIITSDDDIYAIIARKLMKSEQPLAPINNQHLINWTSNTLAPKSKNFTTISAVYSFTEEIIGKFDKKLRPNEDVIEEHAEEIAEIWYSLLHGLDDYKEYLEILEGNGKRDVGKLREESLLLKPVTQMALAIGYVQAKRRNVPLSIFVERLNLIDWNYKSKIWEQVLVMPNTTKVITNKQAITNAGRLIGYLTASEHYSEVEKNDLLESIHLNNPNYQLPTPMTVS